MRPPRRAQAQGAEHDDWGARAGGAERRRRWGAPSVEWPSEQAQIALQNRRRLVGAKAEAGGWCVSTSGFGHQFRNVFR